MKPTASQDTSRTPRTPKCSLMTSVMMNTTGQSITPAVNDSDPAWPNSRQSKGSMPSVSSRAKILTPTNSAISALVTKRPASAMNRRASREASTTAAGPEGPGAECPAASASAMSPPGRDYTRRPVRGRYNPRPNPHRRLHGPGTPRPARSADRGTRAYRPLQARARDRLAAGARSPARGRPRGHQPVRQQLPRPRRRPRGRGRRACGPRPPRLRHGLCAIHLRHADSAPRARAAAVGIPRDRGHDPLFLLLRRQWRAVRDADRRAGRHHLGRTQPREHHRRDPALEGEAAALRQRGPRPARGPARRGERRAHAPRRDRRRVLDGRRDRAARRHLRARRAAWRDRHRRRLACDRVHGAPAGAERTSIAA